MLPGGTNNPDHLRIDEAALSFVRDFFDAGKPAGVICHAPWILINAGVAKGRTLTSFKTIRQDLKTQAPRWWIRKWWWITAWSPAATRTTCLRSAPS
ncbi:MAG: DJ-1/PfpI family protein [Rhodospirillales bacterium]